MAKKYRTPTGFRIHNTGLSTCMVILLGLFWSGFPLPAAVGVAVALMTRKLEILLDGRDVVAQDGLHRGVVLKMSGVLSLTYYIRYIPGSRQCTWIIDSDLFTIRDFLRQILCLVQCGTFPPSKFLRKADKCLGVCIVNNWSTSIIQIFLSTSYSHVALYIYWGKDLFCWTMWVPSVSGVSDRHL